jgi:DNA polymerase-3 subunit delta
LVVVNGADEVLVNEAVLAVVHALVGDDDPTLLVEEVGPARLAPGDREPDLGPLLDAARTPPFLTDRRIVVGRGLARFSKADDVADLVAYLADPSATTVLVLVWEKAPDQQRRGPLPKALKDALAAAGAVTVETDPGRKVGEWVRTRLGESGLRLDRAAVDLVVDHIGEDAARLRGVVEALVATYGPGASLGVEDVEPYLVGSGDVAPWDLTDAVDRGDVAGALATLDRMLGAGRHPLQILATLHNHVARLLALDGSGVPDEKAAAALLGMKGSTFPARKALEQSRRLGSDVIAEMVGLVARADLELKGAGHWGWEGGPDAVVEVLVARLASRAPRGRRSPAGSRR